MDPSTDGAQVRLADTRRLDARGGWLGGPPGRSETLDIRLVSEDGQWRIDNPVNALVVPTSFFDRSFARFNLYFYDQTGRVLLPDPVFIPRGEQTATNLVRGLLAGPGLGARRDQPLGAAVADRPRPVGGGHRERRRRGAAVARGAARLADRAQPRRRPARLDAAPGARASSASGSPSAALRCRCPAAASTPRSRAAPSSTPPARRARELWGLRGGRVVDLGVGRGPDHDGPLGQSRLLDAQLRRQRVAATGSLPSPGTARRCSSRPPRAGRLTSSVPAVDRWHRHPAAVVRHVRRPVAGRPDRARARGCSSSADDQVRRVDVPGVTGADVAAFSVARDGSRLAVAYAGSRGPSVRVIDILRTDEGIVSGAGRSRTFAAGGSDATRLVDVGWRDPATLAVLSRGSRRDQPGQLRLVRRLAGGAGARRAERLPRRRAGDGRRARHRPAAAPDHPRPAALHAERQRQLAAHRLEGRRRRRTCADRSRPQAAAGGPSSTGAERGRRAIRHAATSMVRRVLDAWLDLDPRRRLRGLRARRADRCAAAAPRPCPTAGGSCGRRRARRAWRPASRPGSTTTCCARWCSPTRSTRRSRSPRPLGRVLAVARAAARSTRRRPTVLVPVPSRPAVVRERGHDPMLRITRPAARRLRADGHRVRVRAAARASAVAVLDQAGLDAGQRAANLTGSMAVRPRRAQRLRSRGRRRCRSWSATTCSPPAPPPARPSARSRTPGSRCAPWSTVAATRKRFPPADLHHLVRALPLSGQRD